jgi:hypothetical protein
MRRDGNHKQWRGVVLALTVTVMAGGCTTTPAGSRSTTTASPAPVVAPQRGPLAVVLFGDSLAAQAAPYFDRLIDAGGATASNYVYGGTAVCDWLAGMRQVAGTHPQAAVLEFSGNTLTTCMAGCPPESSSAVARYCSDLETAIGIFLAIGTHVFLIGTPISYAQWIAHDPHWGDLNRAVAALAARHPRTVTFVNAGSAVEGPHGAFTWTLPCLASEPCTGPIVAGIRSNVVRAPDGAHLCAPAVGSALGCSGYGSGAFRFALAMAEPVLHTFR